MPGWSSSEELQLLMEAAAKEPEGTYSVAAWVPVREVNRELDLDLPEEGDWTTLDGLVVAQFGRIPTRGEKVKVEGYQLEVLDASPRRIRTIRIRPLPRPTGEP